ncbi:MAG: heavy metal translocating P-type ATPase [Prevotella sp.]|nr:heavy metal translocating P-type ATPase [Prevotella sp.]
MNKKLLRIIITSVLLVVAYLLTKTFELPMLAQLAIFMVPYLLISYDVLAEAAEGIMEGDPFDEDFLMSVATIGALLIGFMPGAEPQMIEAVFVMLFFQVGELFEDYAEDRSRESIAELMDIRPDTATVERDGETVVAKPDEVKVGEVIVVRPGEKIPLDGVVTEGTSSLNTVALTGESMPRSVGVSDEVVSGCVNLQGMIRIRVSKSYGESTVSKIINLVESSAENKSHSETFIRRFARVYTPIVVFLAIGLAFIPPLFYSDYLTVLPIWAYRALTFLVVSCPCALAISVPLTFFAGIGGASRKGILIKGGNYMETLARTKTVVFDKTGTLTRGVFAVDAVHPEKLSANELLHLAAHVERYSNHPIAAALRQAYPDEHDNCTISDVEEVSGHGVKAIVNGKNVCVGNEKIMEEVGIEVPVCELCSGHTGTIIHVAVDGVYAGHAMISDQIKPDAAEAIVSLRKEGVVRTVMLSGDRKEVAEAVAQSLGIDEVQSELLPTDKVEQVQRLLKEKWPKTSLAFVGDGINDAPVLALADVGIAMGALGSDAAIEAADVVLMDDKPSKIALAMRIARRTLGIAWQNATLAIVIKVGILVVVAAGLLGSWAMPVAVFGDVGVMILAVLNAMRALKT